MHPSVMANSWYLKCRNTFTYMGIKKCKFGQILGNMHWLNTILIEVNICFHPKFILQVTNHTKPFKMRYISLDSNRHLLRYGNPDNPTCVFLLVWYWKKNSEWYSIFSQWWTNINVLPLSSQSYYIALGRAVSNAITHLQSSLNEQPISIDCKWSNDREVEDDLIVDRAIVGRSLGKTLEV